MGASTYSTWLIERLGRSTDCSVVGNLVYTRLIFNNLINYIPLLIRDLLNIKSFDHFIKILKTLKLYNLYILNFVAVSHGLGTCAVLSPIGLASGTGVTSIHMTRLYEEVIRRNHIMEWWPIALL
jgi:hypothetical protein